MTANQKREGPIALTSLPADEVAAALAEDVQVKSILRRARSCPAATMSSKESPCDSAAFMAKMRIASEKSLLTSIKKKELLTEEELVMLVGNRQWVAYAIKTHRVFSVQAPDGVSYFPAFFAGPIARRRLFGKVTQALSGLPNRSLLHFFVSPSTVLGTTPSDALSAGRLKEVMVAAVGFASR